MPDERLPAFHHLIRVEHPEPHVYSFNLQGLMFWVPVSQFNREHGMYEANKRLVIKRCEALTFDQHMKDPFEITLNNDLLVGPETLDKIITWHAMRNDNPKRGTFEDSEFSLFFEPNAVGKNEALEWFENEAIKAIRDARLLRTTLHRAYLNVRITTHTPIGPFAGCTRWRNRELSQQKDDNQHRKINRRSCGLTR
jgi:hypothetical protein